MIPGDLLAVLLVLAVCVPVLLTLIELQRYERRFKRIEDENVRLRADVSLYMGMVVEEHPREFLEADLKLPEGEEVKGKNG